MTGVFLAYSHDRDREFLRVIKDSLKNVEAFEILDPDTLIASGTDIFSAIRSQIQRADVIVALVGSDRPNVLIETGMALGSGKQILLVSNSVGTLPFDLHLIPFVPRTGDDHADAAEIVRRLQGMTMNKVTEQRNYDSVMEKLQSYVTDPPYFDSIPPREFEELIGRWFSEQGILAERHSQSRDSGIDMILHGPNDSSIVVEVKKYNRQSKVSIRDVMSLLGSATTLKANQAILITSSSFTRAALEMAAASEQPQLSLLTLEDILETRDARRLIERRDPHPSRTGSS